MKNAKKMIVSLMVAAILLVMMSSSVFAAESGSAWLDVTVSDDGNTIVSVVTDDAVMDGYIELTFDSESLQYLALESNPEAVAVYSVNADEAGLVKLAWVAPGAYEAGEKTMMLTLTFVGAAQEAPAISGTLHDAEGEAVQILSYQDADKSVLKKAVLVAQALDAVNYTEDSYGAVLSALEIAQAALSDEFISQVEVDSAAEALLNAIDALVLNKSEEGADVSRAELEKAILIAKSLNRYDYSEESFAELESVLASAEAVFADTAATQDQVDAAAAELNAAIRALVLTTDVPNTGRDFLTVPFIGLILLSAAGFVVTVVLLNGKKGRCVK